MKKQAESNPVFSRLVVFAVLLMLPIGTAVADAHVETPTAPAMFGEAMAWDEFLAATKIQRDTWQQNAGRPVSATLVERFHHHRFR